MFKVGDRVIVNDCSPYSRGEIGTVISEAVLSAGAAAALLYLVRRDRAGRNDSMMSYGHERKMLEKPTSEQVEKPPLKYLRLSSMSLDPIGINERINEEADGYELFSVTQHDHVMHFTFKRK